MVLRTWCAGVGAAGATVSGVPQYPHMRNFAGFSSPQPLQISMAIVTSLRLDSRPRRERGASKLPLHA